MREFLYIPEPDRAAAVFCMPVKNACISVDGTCISDENGMQEFYRGSVKMKEKLQNNIKDKNDCVK